MITAFATFRKSEINIMNSSAPEMIPVDLHSE